MPNAKNRQKISTTIASENDAYLKSLIRSGRAESLAEAVDHVVAIARRLESRKRLEASTAAYFDSLSGTERVAENKLGNALAMEASEVDFDE